MDHRTVITWVRDPQPPARGMPERLILMVAQPLGAAGANHGAVAVAVRPGRGVEEVDPEGLAAQLRAGTGWLEALAQRDQARRSVEHGEQARRALFRSASAMDALAVVGEQAGLAQSGMALVNEMAKRLTCSRVSLGLVRKGAIRLQATSHSALLKRSAPIVDLIEDAMEEAVAQGVPLAWPRVSAPRVGGTGKDVVGFGAAGLMEDAELTADGIRIAHAALAKAVGADAAVLSVLLPSSGDWPVGVLTLEREAGPAFRRDELALVQAVTALAGPVVRLQVRSNRWVAGRGADLAGEWAIKLVGPGRPALKLCAVGVVLALAGMAMATGTHRVGARAVVEGEVQRATVAPFDGFVLSAPARAGEVVRAGDLLAALDDRDLVLEARKAWAEREKLRQRHQEAVAKHDRANTAVIAAEIQQATATLTLAEDRKTRARMVAPFDGVIISGDLSQMLGSPVERGKVLFEVAPLDRYRLSLQVDEDNARWVTGGQTGTLRLAGMPGRPLSFVIAQRMPVATVEDGRTVFKAEAVLSGTPDQLRPGMEGVAKIEIGERNLLWVWLHPMFDAARLFIWKWWP